VKLIGKVLQNGFQPQRIGETTAMLQKTKILLSFQEDVDSGVQRSGDALGDCLIVFPLPNFSIVQWCMIFIVTGYALFVTSQHDVKFRFANQRFGQVY